MTAATGPGASAHPPRPLPLTGDAPMDEDNAVFLATWQACLDRAAAGDPIGAAELCELCMAYAAAYWAREAKLLARTGWSRPIVRSHLDDHEAMEKQIASALALLRRGGALPAAHGESLRDHFIGHVHQFDAPMIERLGGCGRVFL